MSFNTGNRAQLSAVLATPINHYREWSLLIRCPSCRDPKQLRVERYISNGGGGEMVSHFIARLRCGTRRRMPDSIKLARALPKREIAVGFVVAHARDGYFALRSGRYRRQETEQRMGGVTAGDLV